MGRHPRHGTEGVVWVEAPVAVGLEQEVRAEVLKSLADSRSGSRGGPSRR